MSSVQGKKNLHKQDAVVKEPIWAGSYHSYKLLDSYVFFAYQARVVFKVFSDVSGSYTCIFTDA